MKHMAGMWNPSITYWSHDAQCCHQVQGAIGTGYLSAFPESHFDRLQTLQPVWAPFYVVGPIVLFIFPCCGSPQLVAHPCRD